MPATSMHRRTPPALSVMSTPSASSTSALPHRLEAARFPCLATGIPAPAATSAAGGGGQEGESTRRRGGGREWGGWGGACPPAGALDLGKLDAEIGHAGIHPVVFEREGSLRLVRGPPGPFGVGAIGTRLDPAAG